MGEAFQPTQKIKVQMIPGPLHFAFMKQLFSYKINGRFFTVSPLKLVQSMLAHQVYELRHGHSAQLQFPVVYIFKNVICGMVVVKIAL